MDFKSFLEEKSGQKKVIVVYGGGFQPFHQGHMSSYEEAKRAFPTADMYVASSNDTKNRPIPFEDKKFLAQQAGVEDDFVQVKQPVNPSEILSHYDPKKDILILVRSERDPVNYTKKDGSPAYYQPFVSLAKCKSFDPTTGHGYIFVTKKKIFHIGKEEVFSGSQVRSMYSKADDTHKAEIIKALYPHANRPKKVKSLLDKYIGGLREDFSTEIENLLTEGVHDKAIFKAIFLSGGPGSGKDYILDNTLAGHGLTEINSDKALEFLMDKNNLDKKMPDTEKEARDLVRGKAKDITDLRQTLALLGRNGLIINGTGDDPSKYAKIKKNLESIGYETSMIAVSTKDEVSTKRNIERGQRGGRTVPENIRKEKWDAVSNARPEMAKLFGNNYKEIDNSMDLRDESIPIEQRDAKKKEMLQLFKGVQEFIKKPPASEQAKQWVAGELGKKDTLGAPKKGTELAGPPATDGAASEASKLGLTYFGFGRYGKNGKVTHHSVHGKLVQDPTHLQQQKVQAQAAKLKLSASSGSPARKPVNEDFDTDFEDLFQEEIDIEFEQLLESKDADYDHSYQQSVLAVKAKAAKKPVDMKSLAARMQASYKKDKPEPAQTKQQTLESYTGMKTITVDGCVYIAQGDKPRVYMLRNSAAKDAHTHNGEIVKSAKGYIVKLKEQNHAKITEKFLQTETNSCATTATSYTVNTDGSGTATVTESGGTCDCTGTCSCGSTSTSKKTKSKITLAKIKENFQKSKLNESIDCGTETGMSMSAGGEGARDTGEKINKKGKATPVAEMQGDETTASIGAQKEDELKKVGISLSTFKKKNYV